MTKATWRYDCIVVGGFGHVGLPLGIVLADKGLQVALYDIDQSKSSLILAGKMPFIEHGAEPLLRKVIGKNLHVSADIGDVAHSHMVIITIGTPVDEYLSPRTRSLFDLAEKLLPFLRRDHCIVLRSTVYPGTSQCLWRFFKEHRRPVELAYCPERIVQGFAITELQELPQVVSGSSSKAVREACKVFHRLGVETIEVEMEEAELIKLFLNSWRYIQFAVGNQFYMMAQDRGLKYAHIYHAMTHHYRRGDLPGPGFSAGPCLLKDTMQLSAAYRNNFLLGHAAMMVNESLPAYIVDQLLRDGHELRGKTVGILGMAFKKDIDDTRDALSFKLRKMLQFHGAAVLCSDEFVKHPSFLSKKDLVRRCSIVIVGVPHTAYKKLAIPSKVHVVDLWRCLPRSA